MRKNLKILLAVALIASVIICSALPLFATEIRRYYGDVNNDGYVMISDARIALRVAVGLPEQELDSQDFIATDLEKDGKITTEDARRILKLASGIEALTLIPDNTFDPNAANFLVKINRYRKSVNTDLENLVLSDELCKAATEAAEEYVTSTGSAFTRQDGSMFYKILDEHNIGYYTADKTVLMSTSSYLRAYDALVAGTQSAKAIASVNFDTIGIGGFSSDGRTFYWCIILIGT